MNHDRKKHDTSTSRRGFLQTSAAAAVGARLALNDRVARSAHVAANETLKIGLVGCGGRGAGAAAQALEADKYQTEKQETMKRIKDGAIGRIVALQETYNCGPPWFRNKERQPEWTEMEYQMRNWYVFTWLSGDHNVEQHVHSLDKAAWAMDDEPPVQVWGSGGRQIRSEIAIGHIFDHHCVVYEYADGARLYSHCRRQAG